MKAPWDEASVRLDQARMFALGAASAVLAEALWPSASSAALAAWRSAAAAASLVAADGWMPPACAALLAVGAVAAAMPWGESGRRKWTLGTAAGSDLDLQGAQRAGRAPQHWQGMEGEPPLSARAMATRAARAAEHAKAPAGNAIERYLGKKLGPRADGVESMPPLLGALAVLFAVRTQSDRDYLAGLRRLGDALEGPVSISGGSGRTTSLDTGGRLEQAASDIVSRYLGEGRSGPFREWLDVETRGHAYAVTALMAVLAKARLSADVPTSEFSWLKVVDRNAYYALNGLGRPSQHPEALAADAHYRAELRAGSPIPEPCVADAAASLAAAADRETAAAVEAARDGDACF